MSEEGESINENINLSSEKEAAPEALENESEIEESLGGQGEQLQAAAIEQPLPSQLEVQAKPKKQKSKATINKIQKSLADTSNQIVKQRTQINKINQNLQSLQKQIRAGERQTGTVNQIRSQVNQIQKRISLLHKSVQKRSTNKLQSGKKISRNKKKNKR
jgi:small-conductance mechanosensitive channel